MPTPIEKREYKAPEWKEFSCYIRGQKVSGFESLLPGSTERLKKIRLVIPIPNDAQGVSLERGQIQITERDPNDPGRDAGVYQVDAFKISWWSPGLKIGQHLDIPCDLAQPLDDKGPIYVQVEQVDLCGYTPDHKPNLGGIF